MNENKPISWMFTVYHFLRIFYFNVFPSHFFFSKSKEWLDSNFVIFNDLFCNYVKSNLETSFCCAFLGEGASKSFQLKVELSVSLEENNQWKGDESYMGLVTPCILRMKSGPELTNSADLFLVLNFHQRYRAL